MITGGSSGLGAGLARSYARAGVLIGLVGRDLPLLECVAAECRARGAEVVTAAIDVRRRADLADWLGAFDNARPVDLLIAAAGVSGGTAPDGSDEDAETACAMVDINLGGAIASAAALAPRMRARRSGRIALIASVAGLRGLPDCPGYSASKAGVRAYADALRGLLAPSGVGVSVVIPGFFDSPMTDRFLGAHPFCLTLDAAVARTRRGLDRGAARIVFPRALAWALIAADLIPARWGDAILRRHRFRIAPAIF